MCAFTIDDLLCYSYLVSIIISVIISCIRERENKKGYQSIVGNKRPKNKWVGKCTTCNYFPNDLKKHTI